MIVLMVLLLVFAAVSRFGGRGLRLPALVFTWVIIIFFLVTLGLGITSAFFRWPVSIADLVSLSSSEKSVVPIDDHSPLKPASSQQVVSQTRPTATNSGSESGPFTSATLPSEPLTLIADSSGAAARAATRFAREINPPDANARMQGSEKEQLKRVIRDLVSIEGSQAPLPRLLRSYVKERDPGNWSQVKDVVAMNAPLVSDLAAVMGNFDGDLVYKDLNTYKKLNTAIKSRAGLYGDLARMNPPSSEKENAELLRIADNFDVLIREMKSVEIKLSAYLND